ncbi:NYN domain-containing protein [Altererythrobacter indicus]|uniref:NYN domain-containing protein n=1 Tax=Altericroceibacterium indicum TaxID=374177 RepID=A0A845A4E6_9SPHN|nr:NYN domain-containing protein [Altericroceibacterium indicum]MXP25162.1 NYN domain-containing protein [Altericroceibacterium indicum]
MADPLLNNIALLIDADNASYHGIDPVLTVLAELGQVNIRRAYGNWAKPALHKWSTITNRFGLQPQQQFDLTKGKNATDMAMTIDAMDLLYAGKVDGFGIMSSDSDFTPLVTRLRQDGLVVYGFGSAQAPEAFKTSCTRYIDVDKLITTTSEDNGEGRSQNPIDQDLIELLGDAWRAASRDDDGFAKLQEVGQIAGNRSSFDVRNHGYKRLSDLIKASDNFKLERKSDNQLYIKRLH